MAFGELIRFSWSVLEFVVDYIWIICLSILLIFAAKTFIDVARKSIQLSEPGLKKIFRFRG